ncbi:MAG: hypothetical protein JXR70_12040 [Spirochaetales bacterium]|nr:hypothetical protein [Spirochaetales bacterium]
MTCYKPSFHSACQNKIVGPFRLVLLAFVFLVFSSSWLGADANAFPDLYDVKLELKDKLLGGVVDLYRCREEVYQIGFEQKVKFTIIRKIQNENDYLFASFLWHDIDSYPFTKQGNASLKRDFNNGGFEFYTLILRDEKDCYLRLTPQGERTIMDIFLFGYHLYKNLVIPLPFQRAMFLSFDELKSLSEKSVDWDFLLYNSQNAFHEHLEVLAGAIKSRLPEIGDNEDGAIDENGRWVYIDNLEPQQGERGLNCSGFAKWVVDGFYSKLNARNMEISPLKVKHPESRGSRWTKPLEERYDLYFALDWTRNLAFGYSQSLGSLKGQKNIEAEDVDDIPLLRYVEDVGYELNELYLALFYLAQKDQGRIYLGAISRPWELNPQQLIYFHVVVLVPYFDASGHFQVKLFERQEDNLVKNLALRYPGDFIHLVRVNAMGDYDYSTVLLKSSDMKP